MRPIPQTIETTTILRRYDPEFDVLQHLQDTADKVQVVVPECIGMSVAWLDQQLAFTLVATDQEIAVLDAVQYMTGGPCVDVVDRGHGLEAGRSDLMDEESWRLLAAATAHRGIASTLTFPLTHDGQVVGSVNLYAASPHAFEGQHEQLAALLGGRVSDVVRNSDLTFATRRAAEESPATLQGQNRIDQAVGLLIASTGLAPDAALKQLTQAAERAGITPEVLAEAVLALYED